MNNQQQMSKKIQELMPGETITSFFVIRKKDLKSKRNKTPYIHLELGDCTGRISAAIWENVKDTYDTFKVGDIIKLKGTVITYQDSIQISIDKIRKSKSEDQVDPKDFVQQGNIDIESLLRNLKDIISSIKNPFLNNLIDLIFNDPDFLDRFKAAPGGKLWHHAYIGGLLEHTLTVAKLCDTMADLYPMADRDILMTGALLHDIGKIDEYSFEQGFIDYTDEGRLIGHISIGAQRIRSFIEVIEKERGFPAELKKHIIHLMLSHQGKFEHGSPVLPMTLEAIILYYSDEMDSKANALIHIIERDKEPGRSWSKYVHPLDRFIYLKEEGKTDKNLKEKID
jgi:3'-5' exoribonuclease